MDTRDEAHLVADSGTSDTEETGGSRGRECSEEVQKNFVKIGITLIVLGFCSVISSIATMSVSWHARSATSSGAWCGTFAIIAGCMAITARFHLNRIVVVSNVVAVSIAAMFGLTNVILSAYTTENSLYSWRAAPATFSAVQGAFAVAWTVVCVYHLVVTASILRLGSGNRRAFCTQYCFGYGMYPSSQYNMPMAYIPADAQGNVHPRDMVFMAAPQYGASMND